MYRYLKPKGAQASRSDTIRGNFENFFVAIFFVKYYTTNLALSDFDFWSVKD